MGNFDERRHERTNNSVRRTTTIDIVRPDDFSPRLQLSGLGRDLATGTGGRTVVSGVASFDLNIDFPGSRIIRTIRVAPTSPALTGLVGHDSLIGFRRRVAELVVDNERTLLLHLLDDVPGATLIAGHSQVVESAISGVPRIPLLMQRNVCAGWRDGSTISNSIDDGNMIVVGGPIAPESNEPSDPLGWHDIPPAAPNLMRRHRLIDVERLQAGWYVSSHFRDSYWPRTGPAGGSETIIHEYAMTAQIDADLVLASAHVTPLVLPWNECMSALNTPSKLVGSALTDIDLQVRQDFRGPETCTHLNDVMRSLAGISNMLGAMID